MNTLQSMMVSTATLLLIFATSTRSATFMNNGKIFDDDFYNLFNAKAPVQHIIKLAVSWNADKQLDHFDELYHHINSNDESAAYAQSIVDATREVLARSLKQVGYQKEMSLEQYLWGTYQRQNNMESEIDADVREGLDLLDKIDGDAFEKLLNSGGEEEIQWELDHLYPYEINLNKSDSTPKPQKPEEEAANPKQSEDQSVPESLEYSRGPASDLREFKKPAAEPQAPEEIVSEPQGSQQDIPEDNELVEVIAEPSKLVDDAVPEAPTAEQAVPETAESEEAVPEAPTPEEVVPETAESEKTVPEPSKSDETVPEPQNSEETTPNPQETEQ